MGPMGPGQDHGPHARMNGGLVSGLATYKLLISYL